MLIGAICGAAILGDGLLPLDSITIADLLGACLGAVVGLVLSTVSYDDDLFE